MGMGEPLANLAQVCEAIERLTAEWGLGYSPRRITVSTAGLVPQIAALGAFRHKVNLAVSLNATTDEVRNRVMGTINRKYPLDALLSACRAYPLPPRRRITLSTWRWPASTIAPRTPVAWSRCCTASGAR
jgi:23S rRNA (adenine2503-C2)-methyltransferase